MIPPRKSAKPHGTGAKMAIASSAKIHSSAILDGDIELGDDVVVGPHAVLEGNIRLGAGCVIRPGACLYGHLTMGEGNVVHSGAVLGDAPQHLKYNNEPTRVEIGNKNVFREHVTVHRGTTHSMVTKIGDGNFFMAASHIAHDCVVGNRCILANGSMVGGHCVLEDSVFLSGNVAVHQFVRIGRLAFIGGNSNTTKDVPPFVMQCGHNNVVGINVVGLRRAGVKHNQIHSIRHAFRLMFREGLLLSVAMEQMQRSMGEVDVIQEMLTFLRGCSKGINSFRGRNQMEDAA